MPERLDKGSLDKVLEKVRNAAEKKLGRPLEEDEAPTPTWIERVFPDAVIMSCCNGEDQDVYEVPYTMLNNEVVFGTPQEVEKAYVEKKAFKHFGPEVSGPIVMKDEEQQIAYSAVLVPGEKDKDGEAVSKSQIERACHEFLENYQNIDLEHSLNNVATPVENYLLPQEMSVKGIDGTEMVLPKGTWILGSKVQDDATWEAVKNGELTGHSVMGVRRNNLEIATKNGDSSIALKKTLLNDLGDDWVPAAVSMVANPAVPKAKFFALKSEHSPSTDNPKDPALINEVEKQDNAKKGLGQRIAEALGFGGESKDTSVKEGRALSAENAEKLQWAEALLKEILRQAGVEEASLESLELGEKSEKGEKGGQEEMTNEELQQAVKQAIQPLEERLESLENSLKSEEEEAEETQTEDADSEDTEDTEDEGSALEQKINDLYEEVSNLAGQKNTASKSIKGQDGEQPPERKGPSGRDGFGRKVRS